MTKTIKVPNSQGLRLRAVRKTSGTFFPNTDLPPYVYTENDREKTDHLQLSCLDPS